MNETSPIIRSLEGRYYTDPEFSRPSAPDC